MKHYHRKRWECGTGARIPDLSPRRTIHTQENRPARLPLPGAQDSTRVEVSPCSRVHVGLRAASLSRQGVSDGSTRVCPCPCPCPHVDLQSRCPESYHDITLPSSSSPALSPDSAPSTCIHRGWACGARRLLRRDLGALSLVPHELSVPHCKAEHRAHDDESELILLEDWVEHLTRREMGSSSARGTERGGTATGGGGWRDGGWGDGGMEGAPTEAAKSIVAPICCGSGEGGWQRVCRVARAFRMRARA